MQKLRRLALQIQHLAGTVALARVVVAPIAFEIAEHAVDGVIQQHGVGPGGGEWDKTLRRLWPCGQESAVNEKPPPAG
ncbi:hypothetical protein GCM10022293_53920 [Azospirillum formosense]